MSLAYLVDGLILAVLGGFAGAIGGLVDSGIWVAFWSLLVPSLVGVFYFVHPYSTSGQTWGKHLVGIRVVSIDGSRCPWGEASCAGLAIS